MAAAGSRNVSSKSGSSKQNDFYQEFNTIQHSFYTSIERFSQYTNYELKKHGYVLLSNLAKGFPHLSEMISNLYGIEWKAIESAAILRALQYRLLAQYGGSQKAMIPQFIYFKNLKPEAEKKERKSKKTENGLIFDDQTKADIMSLLMIDSKTYEYLKFSKKIQSLGVQLTTKNPVKTEKK